MPLSVPVLPCDQSHRHKVLVINSYEIDLYLAWTIEVLHLIKSMNASIRLVNLSEATTDKQLSLFAQVKRRIWKSPKYYFDSEVADCSSVKIKKKKLEVFKTFLNNLTHCRDILSIENNLLDTRMQDLDKRATVHSTLCSRLNTTIYSGSRNILRILNYMVSYDLAMKATEHQIQNYDPCSIIIGNGRLVNAGAALVVLKNLGVRYTVIERGAFPGMLDTYRYSAHSIRERRIHCQTLWNQTPKDLKSKLAVDYIKIRKEVEPISGIRWNRNFEVGKTPKFPFNKKIFVFYTSTETEFAVVGDAADTTIFQNQAEAVAAILKHLPPEEWHFYLRRHPYANENQNATKDPEAEIWRQFSNYANFEVIGPSSKIDSYQLAVEADVVGHFNSSIGPEIIALETTPVLTFGPSMWEPEESKYWVNSEEKFAKLIKDEIKTRNKEEVFPWALYWASFGQRFQVTTWIDGKAFIGKKRIYRLEVV